MVTCIEFFLVAAFWGGSFFFIRLAGPYFGAVPLAGMRLTFGAAVLVPLAIKREKDFLNPATWRKTWVLGLTMVSVAPLLLTHVTMKTSAGFGAILNATAPLFAALIGFLWLKEKLSLPKIMGLLIGFLGVYLLMRGRLHVPSESVFHLVLEALAATCLYGFSTNYSKKHLGHVSPLVMTTISLVVGALLLFPFVVINWPKTNPPLHAWVAVFFVGVGSTSYAFILFYKLVKKIGAAQSIAVTFFVPVFGMLWGYLFLGEPIYPVMIVSTSIIVLGTILSSGYIRELKKTFNKRETTIVVSENETH